MINDKKQHKISNKSRRPYEEAETVRTAAAGSRKIWRKNRMAPGAQGGIYNTFGNAGAFPVEADEFENYRLCQGYLY